MPLVIILDGRHEMVWATTCIRVRLDIATAWVHMDELVGHPLALGIEATVCDV